MTKSAKILFCAVGVAVLIVIALASFKLLTKKVTHPYRPISNNEVENITPAGYKVAINEHQNPMIIPVEMEEGRKVTTILFESAEGYFGELKVVFMDFNSDENQYQLAFDFIEISAENGINPSYDIVDVNNDGNNEISFFVNLVCGSDCVYKLFHYGMVSGELVNFADNIEEDRTTYSFSEDVNGYVKDMYIWDYDNGESHWGCHYWTREIIKWDGNGLSVTGKQTSKKKYANKEEEAKGECEVVSKHLLHQEFGL
ncbi:MAG: hypothetical protein KAS32_11370 [Candidatus Peribacteraceae bacterium]|nr:hypothetical protein [Candidatus Peribacteraceae bacterium]